MRKKKVTRSLLTMSLAALIAMNTKAQAGKTGSNHMLTAGAGIQVLYDEQQPFFADKLNTSGLAYSFTHFNANRKKTMVAGFEKGTYNSGKDQARSNEFIFQYTDAFSVVKNKRGNWNNYTGYSIIVNPWYSKWRDRYSWATINSLALYNSLVYSWKKNRLALDLTLPLAGFGSRPEGNTTYKGPVSEMLYNSFSDPSFTSLHSLKAITVSFLYQKNITGSVYFTAGIYYSYKDLSINSDFLQRAYRLHTGLSYEFK